MNWLYIIPGILALWGLGNLFTTMLQGYFIFKPSREAQNFQYDFPGEFEEFFFDTPGGGRINALLFKTREKPKGLVFYCHGNSGNVRLWAEMRNEFLERGWDLLLWDYRGYGKSKGPRTEEMMLSDAKYVFEQISGQYPAENIILYGRSMGSAFATWLSIHFPAKMLILETPFSSMKELFYTYYPFLPRLFSFAYIFPNRELLRKTEMPVIIFHGTRDFVVPYRNSARLRGSLKQTDEYILIPKAGHNNISTYPIYKESMDKLLGKKVDF